MPRMNHVKAARKSPGICAGCGKVINAGESYKWAKPRYGAKSVAHEGCNIPISRLSSSKMVAVWEAQEEVGKASTVDAIAQALHDLATTTREVAEEYQEGADNQREHFPDSPTADENEQKAEELEAWADEVEEKAEEVDALLEGEEEVVIADLEAERDRLTTEFLDLPQDTPDDTQEVREKREEIEERLEEIEDAISDAQNSDDSKLEQAQELACIADECPV